MKGIVGLSRVRELSEVDHAIIKAFARFNERQASLFGQFSIRGKLKYKEHVENYLKIFQINFLMKNCSKGCRSNTNNNDMG